MTTMPIRYGEHARAALAPTCMTCGTVSANPVADHCHTHGWVRGTLCPNCNTVMAWIDRAIRPGASITARGVPLENFLDQAARCHECAPIRPEDLRSTISLNKINAQAPWQDHAEPIGPPCAPKLKPQVAALNLRLPDDLHAELVAAASEDERSIHGEILWLLRAALSNRTETKA